MSIDSDAHPFADALSTDALEYLEWIRARRIPEMSEGAKRCHDHLIGCGQCLQQLLAGLADPDDADNYTAEAAFLNDLATVTGHEEPK